MLIARTLPAVLLGRAIARVQQSACYRTQIAALLQATLAQTPTAVLLPTVIARAQLTAWYRTQTAARMPVPQTPIRLPAAVIG